MSLCQLAALLLLKRLLRLRRGLVIALRQAAYDCCVALLRNSALKFSTLHALTAAAKGPGARGLSLQILAGDIALAIDLTDRLVDYLLLIRIHEPLRAAWVVHLGSAL